MTLEENFKMVMGGVMLSMFPLEIEANALGMYWYRNSPYEFVLTLLFGIGLAWACQEEAAVDV